MVGQLRIHLPDEAHRHYCLGNTRKAQLLAVDVPRIGDQYGDGHFFCLYFIFCKLLKLKHLALVTQVYFFIFGFVGERNPADQWACRLRARIYQEEAFGIEPDLLLPCVKVGVK